MVNPNVYILGGRPEIDLTPVDITGLPFVPSEVRLSIKEPDGVIVTVSGVEITQASGYLFYLYQPEKIGWYEYEGWVKDGNGREDTASNGFEVTDRVF